MTRPLWSVSDVAEELMGEFGARVSMSTITRTVMLKSCDGTVPLQVLAEAARDELARMVEAEDRASITGSNGSRE